MKAIRLLAIIPLALISVMNLGYLFELGSDIDLLVIVLAAVLGVAGVVAAFGMARSTPWGIPAAVAVSGVNVLGAIIAVVADSEGAIVGLVVSTIALALSIAAGSSKRSVAVA